MLGVSDSAAVTLGPGERLATVAYGDVVRRLAEALATRPPTPLHEPGYRRAAVAVLLTERAGGCRLPMIIRGATAPTHSGQVAFPGGTCDPDDLDPIATARREAHEELGVPPAATRVLGVLDDLATPTGFIITPVVAELAPDVRLAPDAREVAGWFEAPLDLFFDRAGAASLGEREWKGVRYHLRAYRHADYLIWGATARIMEAVIDLLTA